MSVTRAILFQFDDGKVFDTMFKVMCDTKSQYNKICSEKALATIANMSNKKENNLPMAQNTKFISKLIEYCKVKCYRRGFPRAMLRSNSVSSPRRSWTASSRGTVSTSRRRKKSMGISRRDFFGFWKVRRRSSCELLVSGRTCTSRKA